MSQVYVIDPVSGKLVQPKLADDVTARFTVVNNQPQLYVGEGPTTWAGLSDTLSFFSQPDAPPPFVFVSNMSNFTCSARWGDWDTKGHDWTAVGLICTILDGNDSTNPNLKEYISVGDLVLQTNFDEIRALSEKQTYSGNLWDPYSYGAQKLLNTNSMLLFAHKKIVTFVPSVRDFNMNYAYQTISHGNVDAGPGNVKDMYYALGCSMRVYNQDIGEKSPLPVILKAFLATSDKGILYKVTEDGDFNYSMTSTTSYMEYPILNAFKVSGALRYYSPVRGVGEAVRLIMTMLLSYGKLTDPVKFHLNAAYDEPKTIALAKVICNSSAEPDLLAYNSFCSCLGRKDVETKLREVTASPTVTIACISKACRAANEYVFQFSQATPCAQAAICIDPVNSKNIDQAIENYTNTCAIVAPPPLLGSPPPPPPPPPATTPPPVGTDGSGAGGGGGSTPGSSPGTGSPPPPPPAAPSLIPGLPGIPPPAADTSGSNVGTIAGAVVGVLLAIVLIIVVVVVVIKRKSRPASGDEAGLITSEISANVGSGGDGPSESGAFK